MNPYHKTYLIAGKTYTAIQLLKLAGLHGIHSRFERSNRISLEIHAIDEGAILTISSSEIIKLQVAVYPDKNIIRNTLIISRVPRSGNAHSWVSKQSEYARRYNYKSLRLDAERDDDFTITSNGSDYKIPLIGYAIWMKFGYLMHPASIFDFKKFLSKHDKGFHHDILEVEMNDKDFWKEEGYTWPGVFDLVKDSDSEKILQIYRPGAKN